MPQFLLGKSLQIDDLIVGAMQRADDVIAYDLKGHAIAILDVLNDEGHQKC
jgi:hypothetical protein